MTARPDVPDPDALADDVRAALAESLGSDEHELVEEIPPAPGPASGAAEEAERARFTNFAP